MTNAPGFSTAELLLAITLLGIITAIAVPQTKHSLDIIKVRSAREAAFGVAAQARSLALARGGADLVIDVRANTISARDHFGAFMAGVELSEYGVDLADTDATADTIVLTYDAHGIGRIASRTLRFRRGNATAGLTFSSYGRVRRW